MKLPDYDLKSVPQELVDYKDDLTLILNFGKISHQVVTTNPTWSGRDGETLFKSVSGKNSWLYYLRNKWNGLDFSSSIINSWITFSTTGNTAILDSLNVTSLTINPIGANLVENIITWDRDYANAYYSFCGTCKDSKPTPTDLHAFNVTARSVAGNPAVGSLSVITRRSDNDGEKAVPYVAVAVVGNF